MDIDDTLHTLKQVFGKAEQCICGSVAIPSVQDINKKRNGHEYVLKNVPCIKCQNPECENTYTDPKNINDALNGQTHK